MGLAPQRHLVDGQGAPHLARPVHRRHGQGIDDRFFGRSDPLDQAVFLEVVHQEADRAEVHAVDRTVQSQGPVQGIQHEAVAAQGDDDVGVGEVRLAVAGLQASERLLGVGPIARDEGEAQAILAHGANKAARGQACQTARACRKAVAAAA